MCVVEDGKSKGILCDRLEHTKFRASVEDKFKTIDNRQLRLSNTGAGENRSPMSGITEDSNTHVSLGHNVLHYVQSRCSILVAFYSNDHGDPKEDIEKALL